MHCKFFVLSVERFILLDIDECDEMPCDSNAACANAGGGFECICNKGYTGNGTICSGKKNCMYVGSYVDLINLC